MSKIDDLESGGKIDPLPLYRELIRTPLYRIGIKEILQPGSRSYLAVEADARITALRRSKAACGPCLLNTRKRFD